MQYETHKYKKEEKSCEFEPFKLMNVDRLSIKVDN